MHTYQHITFFILLVLALPVKAQETDTASQPATHWSETAERRDIQASALPTSVLKSFETSEFSDMNIIQVHKVIVPSGKDSRTSDIASQEGSNTAEQDSADIERGYTMREESQDIAETYYQDTYDQLEKPTDSLTMEERYPDTEDAFFEIQVKGEVSGYKLLFDDQGDIRHTEIMDM